MPIPVIESSRERLRIVSRVSAVLVTGCSSGIGRATAERLARAGWTVYASGRKLESLRRPRGGRVPAAPPGRHRRELDAGRRRGGRTGRGRRRRAREQRGLQLSGAVESVSLETRGASSRRTSSGWLRLTQLVLPGMRRAGLGTDRQRQLDGRAADVPRWRLVPRDEARGRGAQRRASLRGAGLRHRRRRDRTRPDPDGVRGDGGRVDPRRRRAVRPVQRAVGAATAGAYDGFYGRRLGGGPDTVARTIERALSAKRPRTRYRVTPSAKLFLDVAAPPARPRLGRAHRPDVPSP